MTTPHSLLKYSKARRVGARGLQCSARNQRFCRPGALTGRFLQHPPKAFRKFKLVENQREDTTPLGLVIIGELTQGSPEGFRGNPGLNDGIPLGFGMGISERHYD
jgi:hypothetical protein